MNPISSHVFGERGLSQVKIPVAFVGGSNDLITPVLLEQIQPFAWLGSREKYLLTIDKGVHSYDSSKILGVSIDSESDEPKAPLRERSFNPQLARDYVKAMSLAFMQTHIAKQTKYRRFLSNNYAQHISKAPMRLYLID